MRRRRWITALLLALAATATVAGPGPVAPFEGDGGAGSSRSPVDQAVRRAQRAKSVTPARRSSDEVFVRRVHLDTIGTIPEPEEVVAFLEDPSRDKRAKLVDRLLARDEFADYQALRFADLLRVKSEFPINLWPNAVQAYHRWIRDRIRANVPFDRIARELLTSSGSNFRVPAVNFYRAVPDRSSAGLAAAASLAFLGARFDSFPPAERDGLATLFSKVRYKSTSEWKEEIVYCDPSLEGSLEALLPGGVVARVAPDEDPRRVFADWLLAPGNPRFARSAANRVWAWLMGRGVVDEPDDFRPDNPPSIPALLDALAAELVESGYDLRHLYRVILVSETYQQSPIPTSRRPGARELFASYPVRRLDAEVLIDAICRITGTTESYSSAIPEPFTNVPPEERTIELADGSISSPFLEMFGRPARDTGLFSERSLEPTEGQRLHLLNSTDIRNRIERGPRLLRLATTERDPKELVRKLWLLVLSREPTAEEIAAVTAHATRPGVERRDVFFDVVWALLNSKEFLYRH